MKRPTTLLHRVLLNEGLQVSTAVERDWLTITSRFEAEGMSFLTITLPSLCDTLDQGLAQGRIEPSMFMGFKPWRRRGKLPALLSGFFMRIFDLEGVLLVKPCIDSIRAIRQITRLYKKVELPCSPARIKRAYERYISNDIGISETDRQPRDYRTFDIVAACLWSRFELTCDLISESPGKYGPGATAEHLKPNERYGSRTWNKRSDPFFPVGSFLVSRPDRYDVLADVVLLEENQELPVRVVQVPKTLKTPRTISVEPSHMMLMQQSVCSFLYTVLESGFLGFNSIRFTDQTVNREKARVGSLDGQLSTIDLSDASDLVSNQLVKRMLRTAPSLLDYIQAARSGRARLPDGNILVLNKYASMGSALCFPIESMVFLTIVVSALVEQSGKRPSARLVRDLCKKVDIYGDDIIVPSETAPGVVKMLEDFGLRVNRNKSFFTGLFRESCGGDYYQGHDVTPVYVRHLNNPGRRLTGSQLVSSVSLSNQFYMKGLWHVAQSIRDELSQRGYDRIPRSTEPLGVLSYRSEFFNTDLRWDKERCAYRVRGYKPRVARDPDSIKDESGFIRFSLGPTAASDYRRDLQRTLRDIANVRGLRDCQVVPDRPSLFPGHEDRISRFQWTGCKTDLRGVLSDTNATNVAKDPMSSVRSHSLSTKNGWSPVHCTGFKF